MELQVIIVMNAKRHGNVSSSRMVHGSSIVPLIVTDLVLQLSQQIKEHLFLEETEAVTVINIFRLDLKNG